MITKDKVFSLKITESQVIELKETADSLDISASEFVREAISGFLEYHKFIKYGGNEFDYR
jgi:hypothetical protein